MPPRREGAGEGGEGGGSSSTTTATSESDDGEVDDPRRRREARRAERRDAAREAQALYGADLDDADGRWADRQREGRRSDALLSCPCCLETLCIDCQRHATYKGQYRAMFVTNVVVQQGETLREAPGSGTTFQPAACGTCRTEVGVYDPDDEVYTFFRVVASEA